MYCDILFIAIELHIILNSIMGILTFRNSACVKNNVLRLLTAIPFVFFSSLSKDFFLFSCR